MSRGRWLRRRHVHDDWTQCDPPPASAAGLGSVWQCECGQRLVIVRYFGTDKYWHPLRRDTKVAPDG